MDVPLDQETANADLITDIVAPALDQAPDVSDLARQLSSGGDLSWRDAWTLRGTNPARPDEISTPTASPEGSNNSSKDRQDGCR